MTEQNNRTLFVTEQELVHLRTIDPAVEELCRNIEAHRTACGWGAEVPTVDAVNARTLAIHRRDLANRVMSGEIDLSTAMALADGPKQAETKH